MRLVVDSSVFLAVALSEPERSVIVTRTAGAEAHAPEILPYELGNALSAMTKRGRISANDARAAYQAVANIPVRLMPIDIEEALSLAIQFEIYAYDAYFLECARMMACSLITLDRTMQRVGTELGIKIVEVGK